MLNMMQIVVKHGKTICKSVTKNIASQTQLSYLHMDIKFTLAKKEKKNTT